MLHAIILYTLDWKWIFRVINNSAWKKHPTQLAVLQTLRIAEHKNTVVSSTRETIKHFISDTTSADLFISFVKCCCVKNKFRKSNHFYNSLCLHSKT